MRRMRVNGLVLSAVVALLGVLSVGFPKQASAVTIYYEIHSKYAQSLCLDADANGHGGNGSKVQLWTCGDQSADWQFWSFEQRGPGVFKIHNSQSGHRCLDANISGGRVRNGTAAQLWDCWETSNQLWYRYEVNGRTLWVNGGPGQKYCLDADSSSQLHNGTRIQLWECNINADWQSWVWAELP